MLNNSTALRSGDNDYDIQNRLINLSQTTLPTAPPARLLLVLLENTAPFQAQHMVAYETQDLWVSCGPDNPYGSSGYFVHPRLNRDE